MNSSKNHINSVLRSAGIAALLYSFTFVLTFTFAIVTGYFFDDLSESFYELIDLLQALVIFFTLLFLVKTKNSKLTFPKSGRFLNYRSVKYSILLVVLFRVFVDPIIWFQDFSFSGIPNSSEYTSNFKILTTFFVFLSTVILAPIIEELVFRGLIIQKLNGFQEKYQILISSILFASIHLPTDSNSFVILFLLGILLGYISLRLGLIYAIISHSTYNLFWLLLSIHNLDYWKFLSSLDFNGHYWVLVCLAFFFMGFLIVKLEYFTKR